MFVCVQNKKGQLRKINLVYSQFLHDANFYFLSNDVTVDLKLIDFSLVLFAIGGPIHTQ